MSITGKYQLSIQNTKKFQDIYFFKTFTLPWNVPQWFRGGQWVQKAGLQTRCCVFVTQAGCGAQSRHRSQTADLCQLGNTWLGPRCWARLVYESFHPLPAWNLWSCAQAHSGKGESQFTQTEAIYFPRLTWRERRLDRWTVGTAPPRLRAGEERTPQRSPAGISIYFLLLLFYIYTFESLLFYFFPLFFYQSSLWWLPLWKQLSPTQRWLLWTIHRLSVISPPPALRIKTGRLWNNSARSLLSNSWDLHFTMSWRGGDDVKMMTVSSSSFRVLYAAATLFLTDSGAWIGVSFITATVGGTGRFRQRRCRSSWDFWWCEGVGGITSLDWRICMIVHIYCWLIFKWNASLKKISC